MLLLSPSFLFLGFFLGLIIFRNCFKPTLTLDMASVMEFMLAGGLTEAVVTVVALCAFGMELTEPLSLRGGRECENYYLKN